jgi:RecJ-like exonuclease
MGEKYLKVYEKCKFCKGKRYINGIKCERCNGKGEIFEKILLKDISGEATKENARQHEQKSKCGGEEGKFYKFYVERNKNYSKK